MSKYLCFIDQQEDSLLSSSDESSIFILGSKNSVSFKPGDLMSLKYCVAFLYSAFLRSSKAGHTYTGMFQPKPQCKVWLIQIPQECEGDLNKCS